MLNIPAQLASSFSKINQINPLIPTEIQFSGPTYQVKIWDPGSKEEFWTFIQLNGQKEATDLFCSCKESEATGGCPHLVTAFMSLFDESQKPLHERFFESFWHIIGQIWFHRYGKNVKGPGFKAISSSDQGALLLDCIKGEKIAETEENSIKFSNLSEEELEAWRAGHPSFELLFELSGWSSFVKQLMLYKKPISISFQESQNQLPSRLHIKSDDFEIKSNLQKEDLEKLIPTLNTIFSNLKTYNQLQDACSSIVYDEDQVHLKLKTKNLKELNSTLTIGDWVYKPDVGFYPIHSLLETWGKADKRGNLILNENQIESFFNCYGNQIRPLLKGAIWHLNQVTIKHELKFDKHWNLTITPYVQNPSDLNSPKNARWGRWLYLPTAGFFALKEIEDNSFQETILEKDVSEFVLKNADWLNQQPGFSVHLGSIETQVSYHVDAQGSLIFERHLTASSKDFAKWIYVKNVGFFNKSIVPIRLPIDVGIPLKKDLVASFIQRNLKELELIPGFISKEDPFISRGIEMELDAQGRIFVHPKFTLKEKFETAKFHFYDEWVFIKEKGFYEIPLASRLPEKISTPFWVSKDDIKEFIEKELPSLEPWIQKIDPQLRPPLSIRLILDEIKEGIRHSWKLYMHYQTERGPVLIKTLLDAIHKKEKYLFLPIGRLDLTDERFLWLKRLNKGALQKDHSLVFSTIELLRLHAFEDISASKSALNLFQEVIDLKKTPPFETGELKSQLRPYQKLGGQWLFSLYNYLLGGLLCDEMGLGKTHQAMSLIAALRNIKPNARFLVICPTSVLYHWEDKLKDFFPTLKSMTFHGSFRKPGLEPDVSLLLTSYGVLRQDIEWINKEEFDVAIYDEIQVAKNHRSKLYLSLQKVKADVKIGLTGTPLENKLRELKTLFDLVLPGYMPQESEYSRLIVRPIERMRDMQKKSLLQRLIAPFILRRRKIDVLKDLPEKTETIAHCELTPSQDKLYKEALLMQQKELLHDLMDNKRSIPFIHVFSLLSRLKQICNHPALYLKNTEGYDKYHSGKWELFVELLQEARDSQQKVVVYSQYLGMLDIIENYLKKEGIGFASLRGSTRDRKEQIELFASDPTCEVFVASLKAAGLGIDLTAASVVIHYDRWWNAARENQATDRVHRYGQSRGVQVFKLVTKNTFEERIDQIIERKKHLFEESIAVDEHDVMKSFTREELFELLQYPGIQTL